MLQIWHKALGLVLVSSLVVTVSNASHSEEIPQVSRVEEKRAEPPGVPRAAKSNHKKSPQRPPNFSDLPPDQEVRVLIHLHQEPAIQHLEKSVPNTATRSSRMRAMASQQSRVEATQRQLLGKLKTEKLALGKARKFSRVVNAVATSVKAGDVEKIRAMPEVRAVTISRRMRAFLSQSVDQIGAPAVWEMQDGNGNAVTGEGITIAILDTGIDYTHPDLGGCFGDGCKVAGGWDFVNDDSDPMDDESHGTAVAGVAAANGTVKGVAPNATLYAYKVLDEHGRGWDDQIIAGIERAVDPDGDPLTDDAVDIINLSLGGYGGNTSAVSQAANAAMQAGVVVVAAAGNDGPWLNSIGAPGSARDIVTVGAVDGSGNLADFSSRGIFGTGLDMSTDAIKPEVLAPGVGITTTDLGGGTATYDGTSFSSPHAAGAAALLRQLHPGLDSREIKSLLVNRGSPVAGNIAAVGAGVVDVSESALAQFLVSPATLYMGHIGNHTTPDQTVATFTVKNLGGELILDTLDSGGFPEGARLVPEESQATVDASGEHTLVANLEVDTEVLGYPEDIHMTFGSVLQLTSGEEVVNIPVGFHRAELLELRESEPPIYYWGYRALLFDDENFYGAYSDDYESDNPVLYVVVRDKPVTGIFHIDQTSTFHGVTDHEVDDGPVVIPVGREGFRIVKPEIEEGKPTEFVEQVLELTHADKPDFRIRFAYGVNLAPARFSNLTPGFKLGYMGMIGEADDSPYDRQLYLLKTQVDGPVGDITFDVNNFSSSSLLISNPLWNQSGYKLVTWGLSYYEDWGTYGWGSNSRDHSSSMLLTLYGDESTPIEWPAFPAFSVDDTDGSTISHSWEFSVGEGKYRKLRQSGSEVDRVSTVLERDEGTIIMGQGLRFWSTQLENQGGLFQLHPDRNGYSAIASASDSWGNGYPQDITYLATCAESGQLLSSGVVTYSSLFSNYSSCSTVEVVFGYPTFLGGTEFESTSVVRMANLDQSASPHIEMVELISGGEVSVYAETDASIAVSVDESQPISEVTIELALDGGVWEALETENTSEKYIASLPVVDGMSQADLKIGVVAESGNSIVNTISGAFLLGAETVQNVDIDDDGVVDAEDEFPLNPTETHDIDGDGVGNNADTDDDGDGVPDTEDQFPLDPEESVDTDGDGIGNNADPDDDGDGVSDSEDELPLDPDESVDTDGDGIGNNEDTDDDGDGVPDTEDQFPLDPEESVDSDGDGIGNNADPDDDGDGVPDSEDDLPLDPDESVDTDGDGIGNNADPDDDGDGVVDSEDQFPLHPEEWFDADGDGIGNNEDTDDDGDGVDDEEDQQPLDPEYWDVADAEVKADPVDLEDIDAARGENDIVVNAFHITSNVTLDLRSLTLQAEGSGDDSNEIERVALYLDRDENGWLGTGDELLSEGDYLVNDGFLNLQLEEPLSLPIGEHHFLVTYEMAP